MTAAKHDIVTLAIDGSFENVGIHRASLTTSAYWLAIISIFDTHADTSRLGSPGDSYSFSRPSMRYANTNTTHLVTLDKCVGNACCAQGQVEGFHDSGAGEGFSQVYCYSYDSGTILNSTTHNHESFRLLNEVQGLVSTRLGMFKRYYVTLEGGGMAIYDDSGTWNVMDNIVSVTSCGSECAVWVSGNGNGTISCMTESGQRTREFSSRFPIAGAVCSVDAYDSSIFVTAASAVTNAVEVVDCTSALSGGDCVSVEQLSTPFVPWDATWILPSSGPLGEAVLASDAWELKVSLNNGAHFFEPVFDEIFEGVSLETTKSIVLNAECEVPIIVGVGVDPFLYVATLVPNTTTSNDSALFNTKELFLGTAVVDIHDTFMSTGGTIQCPATHTVAALLDDGNVTLVHLSDTDHYTISSLHGVHNAVAITAVEMSPSSRLSIATKKGDILEFEAQDHEGRHWLHVDTIPVSPHADSSSLAMASSSISHATATLLPDIHVVTSFASDTLNESSSTIPYASSIWYATLTEDDEKFEENMASFVANASTTHPEIFAIAEYARVQGERVVHRIVEHLYAADVGATVPIDAAINLLATIGRDDATDAIVPLLNDAHCAARDNLESAVRQCLAVKKTTASLVNAVRQISERRDADVAAVADTVLGVWAYAAHRAGSEAMDSDDTVGYLHDVYTAATNGSAPGRLRGALFGLSNAGHAITRDIGIPMAFSTDPKVAAHGLFLLRNVPRNQLQVSRTDVVEHLLLANAFHGDDMQLRGAAVEALAHRSELSPRTVIGVLGALERPTYEALASGHLKRVVEGQVDKLTYALSPFHKVLSVSKARCTWHSRALQYQTVANMSRDSSTISRSDLPPSFHFSHTFPSGESREAVETRQFLNLRLDIDTGLVEDWEAIGAAIYSDVEITIAEHIHINVYDLSANAYAFAEELYNGETTMSFALSASFAVTSKNVGFKVRVFLLNVQMRTYLGNDVNVCTYSFPPDVSSQWMPPLPGKTYSGGMYGFSMQVAFEPYIRFTAAAGTHIGYDAVGVDRSALVAAAYGEFEMKAWATGSAEEDFLVFIKLATEDLVLDVVDAKVWLSFGATLNQTITPHIGYSVAVDGVIGGGKFEFGISDISCSDFKKELRGHCGKDGDVVFHIPSFDMSANCTRPLCPSSMAHGQRPPDSSQFSAWIDSIANAFGLTTEEKSLLRLFGYEIPSEVMHLLAFGPKWKAPLPELDER